MKHTQGRNQARKQHTFAQCLVNPGPSPSLLSRQSSSNPPPPHYSSTDRDRVRSRVIRLSSPKKERDKNGANALSPPLTKMHLFSFLPPPPLGGKTSGKTRPETPRENKTFVDSAKFSHTRLFEKWEEEVRHLSPFLERTLDY